MSDASATETTLSGELMTAPSGLVGTTLLALSGIALVRAAARLVGRAALAYRRPAEVRLSERGLELSHRTLLLGRVLSQGETLIPLANLSSVTREVQYPRLGLYAGLLALIAGTYVGTGLLVDGFRVPGGSPSLLGLGLAAMALGVVSDFVLSAVTDALRKTCRLIVTPLHGRRLCVQGLEPEATDRVLARLADAAAASPSSPS